MKNNSKEADRIQDPPEFAVKFANVVFVLGLLFSILIIIYAIYKIYNPIVPSLSKYIISKENLLKYYIKLILIGGAGAILFGLGLRKLNNDLKVNLFLLIITTGISVYAFETYLEISRMQVLQRQQMAEKMSVPYDTREYIEVLEDLRTDGVEAYPNVLPYLFINQNGINTNNRSIYPLGGISNITTILVNESGYYPIIETDEHGFNNSKCLYKKNKVDIMLTGDSFTEGYSVHSDENISAVLGKSGFNAINIGKGGNGSLLEFAALKEYAEPLKPKIVLWVYYVNDFNDLKGEMKSSFFRKYLNEDDFSQNLISRQDEIDSVLINYANQEYEKQTLRNDTKVFIHKNPDLAIKDIVNATGVDESIVIQIIEEIDRERKNRATNRKRKDCKSLGKKSIQTY